MGAQESWFFIENGKVYYHTENDGVVAMRKGLQGSDEDLGTIEEARKKYLNQDIIGGFRNPERLKKLLRNSNGST